MTSFISGRKAAIRLGISHATVQRWVKLKKLQPVAYQGNIPLFDPAYIDAVADKLKQDKQGAA